MIDSNYAVFVIFCIILAVGESIFSPSLSVHLGYYTQGKRRYIHGSCSNFNHDWWLPCGYAIRSTSRGVLSRRRVGSLSFSVGIISTSTIFLLPLFRFCMEEPSYDPEPFCSCVVEAKDAMPMVLKN